MDGFGLVASIRRSRGFRSAPDSLAESNGAKSMIPGIFEFATPRFADDHASGMRRKASGLIWSMIMIVCGLCPAAQSLAAESVRVAAGAQGNWETAAAELGLRQGFFAKHGLDVQLLWT